MPITISGSGNISGLGTGLITQANMANNSVGQPQIILGTASNGPAFSAYISSQTLSSGTVTKIAFSLKEYDTANCFDNTTNYRFQPTVPGYYLMSGGIQINVTDTTITVLLYKNGSNYRALQTLSTATAGGCYGSSLVYLNGSTDYVELYGRAGSGQALNPSSIYTYFQGYLARSA
jgi:hypothetical protein